MSAPRTLCMVLLAACVIGSACTEEKPAGVRTLDPSFGDPCRYEECSGSGACVEASSGGPSCACDDGYAGPHCDRCAPGHHLDSKDRCVPDRSCDDAEVDPCGLHGSCDDRLGVIECVCDPGYEGPRCTLCANGHGRDDDGDCLPLVLGSGGKPIGPPDDPGQDDGHAPDGGVPDPGSAPPSACEQDTCRGHGSCDEIGADVRCLCEAGYTGARCESCGPGYARSGDECQPIESCYELACEYGECDDQLGLALCTCDGGYAGRACDRCAVGFHEGAGGRCVADQTCTATSCAATADCDDDGGSPVCTCKSGYAGALCDACAPNHYRHYASGTCKPFDCRQNPIEAAATIDFETWSHFPSPANNCASNASIGDDDVTMFSIQGDGAVWTCAPSTQYALTTRHVMLEAGVLGPAQIAFAGQVSSLSFDYAGYSAVAVEFFADGARVGALTAPRRTGGLVSFDFAAPISLFEIRSTSATSQVALDDLAYAPPPCP